MSCGFVPDMYPAFATPLRRICASKMHGEFTLLFPYHTRKKSPLPNKSGLVTAGEKAPVLVLYTEFAPEAIQIVLISLA